MDMMAMDSRESHNSYMREYYKENSNKIKKRNKNYKVTHREIIRKRERERKRNYRITVLDHYSNGIMKCKYCSENRIECLQIDHIEGMGNEQRKKYGLKSSSMFFKWLIDNNFPKGFQVLCANCNWYKRFHPEWRGSGSKGRNNT